MDLSEDQIRDALDKWFGLKYAGYPRAMIDGIKAFTSLEDATERQRAASALAAFFCVHCGSTDTDCQCWNDD